MNWFEIIKNIQISSQRGKQKDIVLPPEEENDECYQKYLDMIEKLSGQNGPVEFVTERGNIRNRPYDDEAYCWFMERVNKGVFLYYMDDEAMTETARMTNFTLDKVINGVAYRYEETLYFDPLIQGPLGSMDGFIFLRLSLKNSPSDVGEYIIRNFRFQATENDIKTIEELEPYDDGIRVVGMNKDELPESLKKIWGNF